MALLYSLLALIYSLLALKFSLLITLHRWKIRWLLSEKWMSEWRIIDSQQQSNWSALEKSGSRNFVALSELNKTESKFSPRARANPFLNLLNLIVIFMIFKLVQFYHKLVLPLHKPVLSRHIYIYTYTYKYVYTIRSIFQCCNFNYMTA